MSNDEFQQSVRSEIWEAVRRGREQDELIDAIEGSPLYERLKNVAAQVPVSVSIGHALHGASVCPVAATPLKFASVYDCPDYWRERADRTQQRIAESDNFGGHRRGE